MRTSPAVLLSIVTAVWGLGCGDSGGSGPLVTVSPPTLTVFTGDNASGFQATLSNGATGTVTWTLDPATGLGSISTTTGTQTSYQPPQLGATGGTVKLRASTGTLGYTATITVNTATTGALTINVSRPTAAPASLTVTGPSGFSQVVSAQTTTTLTKLAPGSYTVTAAEIVDTSSQTVDTKYSAPPVSATVAANAVATATVIYLSEPGYGQLWVAGGNNDLDGFTDDDLFVQRTPGVSPSTGSQVQGIAFDASGALWASLANNTVVSYTAGLATSLPLTPAVTVSDQISNPGGVAIGADGRMWVANCGNNTVQAYALAGGSPVVSIGSTSFNCPRGIAFDAAGNLWVTNTGGSGSVVRFANAAIATTGSATPTVTVTPPSGGTQPYGVALDKDGNVWVAYYGGSKVARYTNGTFTAAAAVLSQDAAQSPLNLDRPVALALDKSGRLWVANAGTAAASGTLSVFSTTDMASSGAPAPLTELTGIGVTVGGLAFNPTAANLPIRH